MVKHHTHLARKLRAKGWTEDELAYAHQTMRDSHHKKSRLNVFLDDTVHWFLFALIVLGNTAVMFSIVPLLVFMPNPAIYGLLLLLGFCFGLLIDLISQDLYHIFQGHHKYIFFVLLPFVTVVFGGIMFFISIQQIPNVFRVTRSPFLYALIYVFAFLLPILGKKILTVK